MDHVELIISFGDNNPLTLNTATQEGLVIKESVDSIQIKFNGDDPEYHRQRLSPFDGRGVVITAKRNNDPRRRLRGFISSLSIDGATITIGKYEVGQLVQKSDSEDVVADQPAQSSLVEQLLAKLAQQQSTIDGQQTTIEGLKAQKAAPVAKAAETEELKSKPAPKAPAAVAAAEEELNPAKNKQA